MQRKKKRLRPYFDVGYKVQLRPEEMMTGKYLEGLYGTIMRIEQRPDPDFLGLETPEDWEHFLRIRSVYFSVKLEDFPELDNYYKQHEVTFRYRELQPLPPSMSEQRLAQYCKERFFKEQDKHRSEAYLGIMRYLTVEWPCYPLSLSLRCVLPNEYYV